MITMKKGKNLPIRISNKNEASYLEQGYTYCTKSEWKKLVRDVNKKAKKEKPEASREVETEVNAGIEKVKDRVIKIPNVRIAKIERKRK